MRNLVERIAWLSFAVACTGGQGGDPGQTTTGGSGGMTQAGQSGAGGFAGGGMGGLGGMGGSAGGVGCPSGMKGVGILSAELDRDRPVLEETIDLYDAENPPRNSHRKYTRTLHPLGDGLITGGDEGFWVIELGEPARAQRLALDGRLTSAASHDLDGDGDDDIYGYGERGEGNDAWWVFIWERVEGELIAHDGFGVTVNRPHAVSIGDVDGDGDLDIASIAEDGPLVMRHDGAFGFTRIEGSVGLGACSGCEPIAVQLDDLDGDGGLDLIAVLDSTRTGDEGTWVSVQHGDGSGVFGEAALTRVSNDSHRLRWWAFYGDINDDSHPDFALTQPSSFGRDTQVIFGADDEAFLPIEPLDYLIDGLLDIDDDGRLDSVNVAETWLMLRYGRGGDMVKEQRYELQAAHASRVVIEPARGGSAPKVRVLFEQECTYACSAECGACVFDTCAECLNHDDCASGECRYASCSAPLHQDAGAN